MSNLGVPFSFASFIWPMVASLELLGNSCGLAWSATFPLLDFDAQRFSVCTKWLCSRSQLASCSGTAHELAGLFSVFSNSVFLAAAMLRSGLPEDRLFVEDLTYVHPPKIQLMKYVTA